MDATDLVPRIESLDDSIDDLEEALTPLLKASLSDTADKLPVLDRAELYVLITYAIESILFSYLRLNEVNARDHPVFRELTRVKQYFEKIKLAESAGTNPNAKLDKAAAKRFIKHALAGNEKHDMDKVKQQAKEKTSACTKLHLVAEPPQLEQKAGCVSQAASLSDTSESQSLYSVSQLAPVKGQGFNENTAPGDRVKDDHKRKKRRIDSDTVPNSSMSNGKRKKENQARRKERTTQDPGPSSRLTV